MKKRRGSAVTANKCPTKRTLIPIFHDFVFIHEIILSRAVVLELQIKNPCYE